MEESEQQAKNVPQENRNDQCHDIMRKEGWDIVLSSSTSYDSSLIILSTASLGFIFGIIKLSPTYICCLPFLILILVLLLLSILSTLLSFWFDQCHGYSLMQYAEYCYIDSKEEYRTKKPWGYYASAGCKFFSGSAFFVSLVLFSVLFLTSLENEQLEQKKASQPEIHASIKNAN